MMLRLLVAVAIVAGLPACAVIERAPAASPERRAEVFAAERAFARTMADRDLAAFASFVADEAVFVGGGTVLRGRRQVVEAWSRFFAGARPPFAWEPDLVEVLESGTLALSSGPVRDPSGKLVARFNSVWRLEADGRWRVVFDKGGPPE